MGEALTIMYKITSKCFQIDEKYSNPPKTTDLLSAVMENDILLGRLQNSFHFWWNAPLCKHHSNFT